MSSGWRLAAISLLVVCGTVARADDASIAKAHFEIGLSYYDTQRWSEAAREFREAYRLAPRPALLYNLARTYQKLDDPGRSVTFYRRYLDGPLDHEERDRIAAIVETLAPRVATVELRCRLPDTAITLDGELLGTAPLPETIVSAGRHEVVSRHDGYLDAHVRFDAVGGSRVSLDVDPVAAMRKQAPARRKWLWPVVGVGATVLVGSALAVGLAVGLSHDYSARGRDGCHGTCVLFDGDH